MFSSQADFFDGLFTSVTKEEVLGGAAAVLFKLLDDLNELHGEIIEKTEAMTERSE